MYVYMFLKVMLLLMSSQSFKLYKFTITRLYEESSRRWEFEFNGRILRSADDSGVLHRMRFLCNS
jgi:hypothetical protein